MTQVVDIRNADDPRDVIHRSVQLLADGELVALATESGYVLAAHLLNADAVQRLVSLSPDSKPFSRQLAIKSAQEVQDYVQNLSRLGTKLTRRYWPGPVAIVLRVEQAQGLFEAVSSETRSALIDADRCGFRVPADDVFREVLRLSQAPLVVATEHRSDSQSTSTGKVMF